TYDLLQDTNDSTPMNPEDPRKPYQSRSLLAPNCLESSPPWRRVEDVPEEEETSANVDGEIVAKRMGSGPFSYV
ncbi:hypothetical protein MMC12_008161, partial [Toensbergia leucococca]|nr:hypothetical protein [Toensbergia leucococca]